MAATLEGSKYAFEHPDEAIAILRKTNPEIELQVGKKELLDTRDLAMTDEVAQHGLGYIDAAHMTRVVDIATKSLNLGRPVPVEEIYTLEFLPKKN